MAEFATRLAISRGPSGTTWNAWPPSDDAELAEMAREDLAGELDARLPELERELALLLAPRDADENASAILEVRAGTGGDEAALFAGDLFRMYQRYAAGTRGWKVESRASPRATPAATRRSSPPSSGDGVFGRLKFESGVHRVQRVPDTETQGRIHTSAATVAVLPEVEDVEIEINDADIRIDTYRSSGAGGQHVNKTDSAVRITHMPSGIVVTSSEKVAAPEPGAGDEGAARRGSTSRSATRSIAERSEARKSQVGSGDRSERIRTYNYPQGADHRPPHQPDPLQPAEGRWKARRWTTSSNR